MALGLVKGQFKGGSDGSGHPLLLCDMTPTGDRVKHLTDGVGSNDRKALCNGTGGESLDTVLHIFQPTIVGIILDIDVGVLVEHLLDGDDMPVGLIVSTRMSEVRSTLCVAVGKVCVPDLIVEKLDAVLGHVLETVQEFSSVLGFVVGEGLLYAAERVSHCYRVLVKMC